MYTLIGHFQVKTERVLVRPELDVGHTDGGRRQQGLRTFPPVGFDHTRQDPKLLNPFLTLGW